VLLEPQVALLELDDRAFSPGLEVWATNPR